MPSGKTHDAITFILAVPAFAGAISLSGDLSFALTVTLGFLFGGLMFGPDLDTKSTQYSRWWALRILWLPYRSFFKHRSRWSHGLAFGALLRVVYFMGVATCVAFLVSLGYAAYIGGASPDVLNFARVWSIVREYSDVVLGPFGWIALFTGTWLGAASHTVTDIVGTYVRTGRARL